MVDHHFTDDVAVCFALTKKKAIEKFGLYYANVKSSEVKLLRLFHSFRKTKRFKFWGFSSHLGLLDIADKHTEHAVKFKYQINSK